MSVSFTGASDENNNHKVTALEVTALEITDVCGIPKIAQLLTQLQQKRKGYMKSIHLGSLVQAMAYQPNNIFHPKKSQSVTFFPAK